MKKKTSDEKLLIYFALAILIGMGLGYVFGGFMVPEQASQTADEIIVRSSGVPSDEETVSENTGSLENLETIPEISVDDDPAIGDPASEADIVIIEFSDYQCPFCKDFYDESFHALKQEYIDTGKVHYVFRDFPLESHPEAMPAAISANCAGEQGKYWEMHNLLFERQDAWSFQPDAQQTFNNFAGELELDMERFEKCTQEEVQKQEKEIAHDLADGSKYTTRSTPTFFINGKKLVGAQPTDTFRFLINREIAAVEN